MFSKIQRVSFTHFRQTRSLYSSQTAWAVIGQERHDFQAVTSPRLRTSLRLRYQQLSDLHKLAVVCRRHRKRHSL